jgi:hypothetical protein
VLISKKLLPPPKKKEKKKEHIIKERGDAPNITPKYM